MKILVTGASGFIGGHLAQSLLERGDDVRVLMRNRRYRSSQFEVVFGDLSDVESLRAAVKGVEAVFHIAAIRDQWGIPYEDYHQVNVEGTRHLLQAAADQGCRFVYCSSVGVMGHPGRLNINESFPYAAGDGKYNYSHTKALADEMTLDYAAKGRLFATVVRPVITYGPGDTWGMVTKLIDMLAKRRFLPVGNGNNHLHLAFISDIVKGFLLALDNDRANGRAYIIAGPEPITLNELVNKICKRLNVPEPRWHIPANMARAAGRGMEALYTWQQKIGLDALGQTPFITRDKVDTLAINRSYSIARAKAELGFTPTIGYDQGLAITVEWQQSLKHVPANGLPATANE